MPYVPLEQMPGGEDFNESFSAKYLPEIGKTDYQGVTAKIQFDENGDLKGCAIALYQAKDGMTVLLAEQNAKLALEVSQCGCVMESGEITLADDADKLLANPKVREACLGE